MDTFEMAIFRTEFLEKIEEFIHIVNIEYDIPLTFSKENLPLFEKVIDQVKSSSGVRRENYKKGLTLFLLGLLLESFEGEVFRTDTDYGVRLFNTWMGKNIEIYPKSWIDKRLQYGNSESITYKFEVLSAKKGGEPRISSEWLEDDVLAERFARRLGVSSDDVYVVNNFIKELLEHPELISKNILNNPESLTEKIKQNEKSYKYLLGRIYKIKYFASKAKFKHGYTKFGRVFEQLAIQSVSLLPNEFTAFLEYIKDIPFGVNDNIFEELFQMEETNQLFNRGDLEFRNESLIHLLELNGRKIYHHNIKELKKILYFIRKDNEVVIDYLLNYEVDNRQGCYKAIEFILSYKFKDKEKYDNFVCQRDMVIWLDNANGREPKRAWIDKLEALKQLVTSQDLKTIYEWILAHNELKYDNEDNWLDDTFSHFEKSAKWYVNMYCE